MKAIITTTLLGLALAALPVAGQQEEAKPRGSSGSSASSSGGRHPSSSGGAVSQSSRSSGGSRSVSSSDRDRGGYRVQSGAQARHPRPGTGRGNRYPGGGWGYRPGHGYYPGYWGGGYYWPWYGSYGWWGWGVYGGWGYPYAYGGYGGYGYYDAEIGSLRLLVEPNKARVYVDGSYAGMVDDFDGIFQRLKLPRGRHDIALKLEGYQTHRLRVYVSPSHTLKIRWEMARGSGETFEDLTQDVAEAAEAAPPRAYAESGPPPAEARAEFSGPGTLQLDVRPGDATVYVDGEFRGAAGGLERLSLPPGRHLLELVRPGFRTVQREVEIRSGKTESVAVDLERS